MTLCHSWTCTTQWNFLKTFLWKQTFSDPKSQYIDLAYIFSECMKSVNSTGAQLDLDSMDSMNRIAYHWLQHVSNMCIYPELVLPL